MGCLSSKEVKDASVARSNPAPAGDHGSLVDDEAREKSSASFAAPSSAWGESRPVPQARQFLDDGPSTSSGPPPASRRSAPTVSAGGPGDAPLDSDDELEAQMRPPPGARAAPAEAAAAADAEAARREKKAKKKRDKHRVTDLEAHDLEGEDPETKTEMLRRRASRRAAETESAAMRVVFGDVDAFSDGDFSPEGSPRKGALGGDGPLITGAAVRRALRPAERVETPGTDGRVGAVARRAPGAGRVVRAGTARDRGRSPSSRTGARGRDARGRDARGRDARADRRLDRRLRVAGRRARRRRGAARSGARRARGARRLRVARRRGAGG